MKDNLTIKGIISLEHRDKDGNLKDKKEFKNVITNTGKAQIALLAGAAGDAFTYLALGTGTTAAAATDTALETETSVSGLARASATVSRQTTNVTNDTLQLVKEFTAAGDAALTECGILNAATTGVLLGRQVFDAVNVTTDDVLTVTYKVVFA